MKAKKHFNLSQLSVLILLCCIIISIAMGCKKESSSSTNSKIYPTSSSTNSLANHETEETYSSVEDILANMTLEQKIAQMLQGAVYSVTKEEMKQYDFGSILSDYEGMDNSMSGWKNLVLDYQKAALLGSHRIPYLYGTDAVHGNIKASGTVVFPHNIGIGAANDETLTYEMGCVVADEMKLTGMLWNFAPCLAAAQDPRWGRTYESYSSDYDLVAKLGVAFSKGLLDNDIMPCAKHFIADGNGGYGTGEGDFIIDRGDATISDEELNQLLHVYQQVIDAGVQTVMVNHGSINGVKLHQYKELITDILKSEMNFSGFVVSDWESIHNIEGKNLKEQVITAINAGIDMLMEPQSYLECYQYILEANKEGLISTDRIDDAVKRILTVKWNMGLFEDPMQKELTSKVNKVGEDGSRAIAKALVEKSLVLLKNENEILPLKKGQKIFVTGPAANDSGAQCGGWTITWQGQVDMKQRFIESATTILDGFEQLAKEYELEIITDESKAAEANITILCVGERPYAEWEGDTEDLSITGDLGLYGNQKSIDLAKSLKKPTIALIVAGRQVLINDYLEDWDAAIMCYLPGSEGDGVANVLLGKKPFTGKLPMPWYQSVDDIGTDKYLYPMGYGME